MSCSENGELVPAFTAGSRDWKTCLLILLLVRRTVMDSDGKTGNIVATER